MVVHYLVSMGTLSNLTQPIYVVGRCETGHPLCSRLAGTDADAISH